MHILICALAFLLMCCMMNCTVEYIKCKTCDQLIEDEINNFRANLICTMGSSNVNPISASDTFLGYDIGHPSMTNSIFITHESCGIWILTYNDGSLHGNVSNFIKSCAARAAEEHQKNVKYSWFWNPETRRIDCVYSTEPFSISCIANNVLMNDFSATFQVDSSFNQSADDYKFYRSNLRFCKQLKGSRSWVKTCMARSVIRENIQNDINVFRRNLVDNKNISNMPLVNWNTELEMVASEYGKVWDWQPTNRNIVCISSSQFDRIQLFYLPLHTSVFNYSHYINPVADILSKVLPEIKYADGHGTKAEYFWFYDTTVTDFGCVFQMIASSYDNLVCAFSGDLENNILSNFKYGPACSGCPVSYYCDDTGNSTKLCRKNEDAVPYRYFIIYGCIIVFGFMVYFYLRHRL